jgi:putative ABC transport system permease protein
VRLEILRQAAMVVAAGLFAGGCGALAFGRWLTVLAFGIHPSDPRILFVATCLLAATALVAAWLPARRASRIAPRIAMQDGH